MKRLTPEEIARQLSAQEEEWAELKARLMQEDFIDDDGYPTDAALELIEKWHWNDCNGLFEFIKDIWYLKSWGWSEVDAKTLDPDDDDYNKDGGKLYFISTAGWSGNESIIRAFESNEMAWMFTWVQSRRGGHYVFIDHEFKDDKE